MIADAIHFRGHHCFQNGWAGFDTLRPINVIIGRNNAGKSHLLDLIAAVSENKLDGRGWDYRCSGVLDENSLRKAFPEQSGGGELGGNWWREHGQLFVGRRICWEIDTHSTPSKLFFLDGSDLKSPYGSGSAHARLNQLLQIVSVLPHKLSNTHFRRLLADRDIRPELPDTKLELARDGTGATNIIRRYIVTANPRYPREVIQKNLLTALNKIFGKDGQFTEIQVKVHDDKTSTQSSGAHWEIFLGEDTKGLVSLSSSGSGLKTVVLVLLNLLVSPHLIHAAESKFTFAFEELENNLHPALLRRLFRFLEEYAVERKATIFLTTHSSTALDIFGVSKNAQIIHVTHDGLRAKTTTVSAHFDHLGVISELGAKPSDLLQANGIIWVEGPSDCIYLNRWIDLYTNGALQEGRDYQCAFYGGSLLARTQFKPPEDAESELVNLFRVNQNIIVICDGDRTAKGMRVKDRVRRIRSEVRKIPDAHIWVTGAREIENYIPGEVLAKAVGTTPVPDPTQFETFFPRKGSPKTSYVESRLRRKALDKMDLAVLCAPHMTKSMMSKRFDWEAQMAEIVYRIDGWDT